MSEVIKLRIGEFKVGTAYNQKNITVTPTDDLFIEFEVDGVTDNIITVDGIKCIIKMLERSLVVEKGDF